MAEPISLMLSAVRVAASIGTFMEKRKARKLLEGPTNANVAQWQQDMFFVAGNMGNCLIPLGIVNTSLLPHVQGDVRSCFQSYEPAFLTIFDEELEEPLQYAVTVAMFFCAACRPVDFMYGFGHGVLNWGTGYNTNPREQVFNTFNACLTQLQIATRDVRLLTRVPEGLSQIPDSFPDKNRKKATSWLNDVFSETKKRGPPQPKDGSFTANEIIMLHTETLYHKVYENYWGASKEALYSAVYQHDAGKTLYAYLLGKQLELLPGQIFMPIGRVDYILLRWLERLDGMIFKLLPDEAFDDKHPKFKKNNRWVAEFDTRSINMVAVRDEQQVRALEQPQRRAAPPPPIPTATPLRKVVAKFDFTAEASNEISFKTGDILEVLKESTGDGWIVVRKAGREGDIPEAYIKNL